MREWYRAGSLMINNGTLPPRALSNSQTSLRAIERRPTDAELDAHKRFLALERITIADLEAFVDVVAPGKKLRTQPGMNVRVGSHIAPPGGPDIPVQLQTILDRANEGYDSWITHCHFETLHPFLDGNGRSGRALWLWQQRGRPLPPLLFLHRFYYETLSNFRA